MYQEGRGDCSPQVLSLAGREIGAELGSVLSEDETG